MNIKFQVKIPLKASSTILPFYVHIFLLYFFFGRTLIMMEPQINIGGTWVKKFNLTKLTKYISVKFTMEYTLEWTETGMHDLAGTELKHYNSVEILVCKPMFSEP